MGLDIVISICCRQLSFDNRNNIVADKIANKIFGGAGAQRHLFKQELSHFIHFHKFKNVPGIFRVVPAHPLNQARF